MPIYAYICPKCGDESESVIRDLRNTVCRLCGIGFLRRKYQFAVKAVFPDHFNPSVGHEITSMAQMNEHLKRQADEATRRTGIPHDYSPVDLRDRDATGATDEGLDATARARRATGQDQPTSTVIPLTK